MVFSSSYIRYNTTSPKRKEEYNEELKTERGIRIEIIILVIGLIIIGSNSSLASPLPSRQPLPLTDSFDGVIRKSRIVVKLVFCLQRCHRVECQHRKKSFTLHAACMGGCAFDCGSEFLNSISTCTLGCTKFMAMNSGFGMIFFSFYLIPREVYSFCFYAHTQYPHLSG